MRGLMVVAAFLALASPAGAAVLGELTQLGGTAGCLSMTGASEVGAGDCVDMRTSDDVADVTISPDGRSAYVQTRASAPSLQVFSRNPATGALTQLDGTDGCISADGGGEAGAGTCTNARAIGEGDGRGMAISRDGRFLYAASENHDGVTIFSRDTTTGRLTQLAGTDGCITANGGSEDGAGTCTNGRGLASAQHLLLSRPDERHLVVGAYSEPGFALFARDAGTGRLTQLDGTNGCVTADGSSSDDGAGTCADGLALADGDGYYMSPDGRFLYTTGYSQHSLAAFSRDPATGVVTQLPGTDGCFTPDGMAETMAGVCTDARALAGAWTLTGSPGGEHLYVGAYDANAIVTFRRDRDTGRLTQLAGTDGCTSLDGSSEDGAGSCVDGRGVEGPFHGTVSPDGRSVYFPGYDADSVVTFARDPATGVLTQLAGAAGCVSRTGTGGTGEGAGTCADGRALDGTYAVTLSPDGAFAYVPSDSSNAISVFSRQASPTCSPVSASAMEGESIPIDLRCTDPNGDALTYTVTRAPGFGSISALDQASGRVTFRAAQGFVGADTFVFSATDGVSSASETATVNVRAGPPFQVPVPQPRPDRSGPRCTGLRSVARAAQSRLAGTFTVRQLLRGRLRVRVRCNEPARLRASLTMTRTQARRIRLLQAGRRRPRPVVVGSGAVRVAANRATTLTVRLSRRTRSRLRRASRARLRRASMTLTILATDLAGNRSNIRRTVRLRR